MKCWEPYRQSMLFPCNDEEPADESPYYAQSSAALGSDSTASCDQTQATFEEEPQKSSIRSQAALRRQKPETFLSEGKTVRWACLVGFAEL